MRPSADLLDVCRAPTSAEAALIVNDATITARPFAPHFNMPVPDARRFMRELRHSGIETPDTKLWRTQLRRTSYKLRDRRPLVSQVVG